MSGLSITNNIFNSGARPIGTTGGGKEANCGAMPGSKPPEGVFHDCFSSYSFHHNVIVGGGGWPKENMTPKKVEELALSDFKNGNGGNYRLSSTSKFKHGGSDQKDIGADIDAIERATKGAE